ncbi:MAG: hypothetical protein WAK16_05425, partial [Candidatus Cybelea sp.]
MSFTTNVEITKAYPGVLYNASESLMAYHEDHEINGTMYRASNAQYVEAHSYWISIDNTKPSYATVQNPNGSAGYLSYPATSGTWTTSEWEGSANNAVYNAVDYGMSTSAADNGPALQAALTAAGNSGGGKVFIPAGQYYFKSSVSVPGSYGPGPTYVGIVIEGVGGSTELVQSANADLFDFSSSNKEHGCLFRDLQLTFSPTDFNNTTYYAVNATVDNVRCEGCYFNNWPTAMYMNGFRSGMLDCTIYYNGAPASGSFVPIMIDMEHSDNFVDHCDINQMPVYDSAGDAGGPTGCIAIKIGSASEPRVSNTNISEFDTGIQISGGYNLLHA